MDLRLGLRLSLLGLGVTASNEARQFNEAVARFSDTIANSFSLLLRVNLAPSNSIDQSVALEVGVLLWETAVGLKLN